jgi:tRNA pseudouridine55 synthase
MEGLVLFNKPEGYTSAQIVNYFKKLTKKKAGHGGTLDPFASGLLIIGIGRATKELTLLLKESVKTYLAEIVLGYFSDTYDIEGNIQASFKPIPDYKEIKQTINSFVGEIYQTPPLYSAIKIQGQPAYKLARKGAEVSLSQRKVKIHKIKVISFSNDIIKIEVSVSSGTYIRSLANDLGQKLGCGAYLKSLERTKITCPLFDFEEFNLKNALTFNDFEKNFLEFKAKVFGNVQGVGLRYFVYKKAQDFGVVGYVKNLADGAVEILAQGSREKIESFIEKVKKGPSLAKVDKLSAIFDKPLEIYDRFEILN